MAGPHPQFTRLEGAAFQTQALFLVNTPKQRMLPCPPVYGFEKSRGKTEALGLLLDGFTSGGGFRQVDDIHGKLGGQDGLSFIEWTAGNGEYASVGRVFIGGACYWVWVDLATLGHSCGRPCGILCHAFGGAVHGIGLLFLISCRLSEFLLTNLQQKRIFPAMKVTVFGTGYVGLVQGAILADVGHHVMCVDVDEAKVARLKKGEIPIYEPGLEPIVKENYDAGRLEFTTNAAEGVKHGEVQFIAVGTPPDEDGSADLQYVLAVAATIAEHMERRQIIVDKSTVPVGTADKVAAKVASVLKARGRSDLPFDVGSNPGFLKEGSAVADCMLPDDVTIVTSTEHSDSQLREISGPSSRTHDKIMVMSVRSAQLTKYAANCMLATKIGFIIESANLAELLC